MAIQVGLNGFGGFTRHFLRIVGRGGFSDLFQVTVISSAADADTLMSLLRRDTLYGPSRFDLLRQDDGFTLNGDQIRVVRTSDAGITKWDEVGIDVVIDGAWRQTTVDHIAKGAKKVLAVSPAIASDVQLAPGLSDRQYDPDAHHKIGVPTIAVQATAMILGVLTAEHQARWASGVACLPAFPFQPVADAACGPEVMSQAAVGNLIAGDERLASGLAELLPGLETRMHFSSVLTSTSVGGMVTLAIEFDRGVEAPEIVAKLQFAADQPELAGLLGVENGPLVSSDLRGDSRTVIVEAGSIRLSGSLVSLRVWFDSEWALACRMTDALALICEAGVPGTA